MARSTMANLISRLRSMIQDPVGPDPTDPTQQLTPVWTDDELQRFLDQRQTRAYDQMMNPYPQITSGGFFIWLDYRAAINGANVGDWESGVAFRDFTYQPIASNRIANFDENTGQLTFVPPADPQGQLPPVRLLGNAYDMYSTAADVFEMWIAKVKFEIAFTAHGDGGAGGGGRFASNQKAARLAELAEIYRSQARTYSISFTRSDLN